MILDELTLPSDLEWENEFNWTPVVRQQNYAKDGALWVIDSKKKAGRPIHFRGEELTCCIKRFEMLQLQGLLDVPDKIMTLTLSDSRQFSVMFDHKSGALGAEQVIKHGYYSDDDYYQINFIRFIEV